MNRTAYRGGYADVLSVRDRNHIAIPGKRARLRELEPWLAGDAFEQSASAAQHDGDKDELVGIDQSRLRELRARSRRCP